MKLSILYLSLIIIRKYIVNFGKVGTYILTYVLVLNIYLQSKYTLSKYTANVLSAEITDECLQTKS